MSSSTRRQCINAICIFHSLVNLSVWISNAANVRMGVHISRGLQSISEYKGMLTTFAFYEASPPPDMLAERHPALFTTARWNTMHKSAFTRPTAVKSMITIRWFIDFAKIRIYNRSMHLFQYYFFSIVKIVQISIENLDKFEEIVIGSYEIYYEYFCEFFYGHGWNCCMLFI